MKIFDPSSTVRVGDSFRLPLYCSEPGSVVVTSSDEGVASVASPVTVGGSRTYRMNNRVGDGHCYGPGPETAQRNPCTIYCTVPFNKIQNINAYGRYNYALQIARNYNKVHGGYTNYYISTYRPAGNSNYLTLTFYISLTKITAPTFYALNIASGLSTLSKILRIVITINGTALKVNTSIDGAAPVEVSATMAETITDVCDNSTLLIADGSEFAHWSSVITGTDFTDLVRYGTIPAGANCVYLANEETGNTLFDTSGNLRDSTLDADATYPSTGISRVSTDDPGDPVQPYQYIDVLAQGVGTTTITARRRRNGVPYRTPALPDAEVYEETTYVLTVAAATAFEQSTVQLMIYADRDGTATITMDNAIIAFPASVPVVEGKNQVSGLVTGSGTCNVTVTLDGVSDVTTFDVEEILTRIKTGPRQIYGVYL